MTPAEPLLTPRHCGRHFQKIPSLVSGDKWSLKFASEEGEARPGGSAQVRGAVLSQRGSPRPLSSAGACVWRWVPPLRPLPTRRAHGESWPHALALPLSPGTTSVASCQVSQTAPDLERPRSEGRGAGGFS